MLSSAYLYSFISFLWELTATSLGSLHLKASVGTGCPGTSVLSYLGVPKKKGHQEVMFWGSSFWLLLALMWNDWRDQTDLGHKAIITLIISSICFVVLSGSQIIRHLQWLKSFFFTHLLAFAKVSIWQKAHLCVCVVRLLCCVRFGANLAGHWDKWKVTHHLLKVSGSQGF